MPETTEQPSPETGRVGVGGFQPTKEERHLLLEAMNEELRDDELRQDIEATGHTPGDARVQLLEEEDLIWGDVAHELTAWRDFTRLREAEQELQRSRPSLTPDRYAPAAPRVVLSVVLLATVAVTAVTAFRGDDNGVFPWVGALLSVFGGLIATLVNARSQREVDDEDAEERIRRMEEFEDVARERFLTGVREKAIRPLLRLIVADWREPSYSHELVMIVEGLGELYNPRLEVSTAARLDLDRLISTLPPGASIGVAGSRGAGKSTLLRSFASVTEANGGTSVTVPAPTSYEPRDFVLALYARLCEAVLTKGGRRGRERVAADEVTADALMRLEVLLVPISWACVLVGALLFWMPRSGVTFTSTELLGASLIALGYVSMFSAFWSRRRRRRLALARTRAESDDRKAYGLRIVEAERRLREIRFQQSFSTGYSGALRLPVGIQASVTATEQIAARQKSFPELVEDFRAFVQLVASDEAPVVICIDEMDKMESAAAAQKFLNELKTIFGVSGCYYLLSVSEEAINTFERRGMPFRDVFDSSFDEVLVVPPLRLAEAKVLINARVRRLSVPFICLAYCMAGGLPRELVRVTRQMDELRRRRAHEDELNGLVPTNLSLEEVCDGLVRAYMVRHVRAVATATRGVTLESELSALLTWAQDFLPPDGDAPQTSMTAQSMLVNSAVLPLGWPRDAADHRDGGDATDDRVLLDSLRRELAVHAYFCATLLQFFDARLTAARLRAAEHASIERLARARQVCTLSHHWGWKQIAAFRAEQKLTDPAISREVVSSSPRRRGGPAEARALGS
jgi:energy-coupling factor transporter ATP-binding protein EcfA2